MKKLTYSIFIISLFIITANASQKMDVKDIELPQEFKANGKIITEDECKKYLGEENYKFIQEIYNDKVAPLLKCKEEMK